MVELGSRSDSDMTEPTFLAIDCGGTRSRVLLEAEDGSVLVERENGPANWAATPRHELAENLKQLLEGLPTPRSAGVFMAGLLTEGDRAELTTLLNGFSPAHWNAFPDTMSSLAACDNPDAVCVISGTGSGICSFDSSHQMVKSGGGGPLIGDFGSGFYAGRVALARFLSPEPELPDLAERLEAEYGPGGLSAWLSKLYAMPSPQAEIAQIGSLVASLATEGNEACQGILADALQPLANLTLDHMRSQGFPERPFRVYLSGGFWEASHYVPKLFGILLRLPTYRPPLTPLQGAMKLVRSLAKS